MWTLVMPRKDEKGVIVIGGYASPATVQYMGWTLWNISTVDGAPCEGSAADRYCIEILGLDTLATGSKTTPMTPSDPASTATYLIDSLSNVIRTYNTAAKAVAESFVPPGWADPASGAWFVDCKATLSQTFGVRLEAQAKQRAILISKQDIVIGLGNGKCISAFQPPDSDGKFRLGWPFLKNTVIVSHLANAPTTFTVVQKVLPENAVLQLID